MTKPKFLRTRELGKCGELGVSYSPGFKKHVCNKSPHFKFFFTFEGVVGECWGDESNRREWPLGGGGPNYAEDNPRPR